ncbi:MAG: ABC transporter substrate-binding protein [Magnetococcales bacterium]|nr:ABC transporter substrate-binding protein [Magnetococcales bacterium]
MMSSRPLLPSALCLGFFLALWGLWAIPAQAEEGAATREVHTAIDQSLEILLDPALAAPEQRDARRERLKQALYPKIAFPLLARGAVGNKWNKFTPEQQARFIEQFKRLLEDAYLSKIENYRGEKVLFTKEIEEQKGRMVRVESLVEAKGQKFQMFYRMTPDEAGQWRIFDIVIEGVSLANNYRSQFNATLSQKGPEGLLKELDDKLARGPAAPAIP